jgi:hypothetical protein
MTKKRIIKKHMKQLKPSEKRMLRIRKNIVAGIEAHKDDPANKWLHDYYLKELQEIDKKLQQPHKETPLDRKCRTYIDRLVRNKIKLELKKNPFYLFNSLVDETE